MAYSLTRQDLHGAAFGARSKTSRSAVRTAVTQASVFGFGFLNGYYGDVKVLGVPVDLGAGLLITAGSTALGSSTVASLGTGALAVYFAKLGAKHGDLYKRTRKFW